MQVRAKFYVSAVTEHSGDSVARTIKMSAAYDDGIPENQRFHKSTPSGTLEMYVTNPEAIKALEVGKFYYLEISPADAETE